MNTRLGFLVAASLTGAAAAQVPHAHLTGSSTIYDAFGFSIAGNRDYTGDALSDVLVGAPAAQDTSGVDVGAVYLYSGATGALSRTFFGPGAGSYFGTTVAALDDVTGDGTPEIAVTLFYPSGTSAPSQVQVIDGVTGSALFTLNGLSSLPGFGLVLETLSDVDGDGFVDLAAADPWDAAGGKVYVFSGATGVQILPTIVGSGAPGDVFGNAVARIGDLDSDGVDDLLIGSPGDSGAGRLSAYSGATGLLIYSVTQAGSLYFGMGVDSIGDTNGDGIDDFVVSDPYATPPTVWVKSGSTGSTLLSVTDGSTYASPSTTDFGANLLGLDDWNGDGLPEFAVCANWWGGTGAQAGIVAVYSSLDGSVIDSFWGERACDSYGFRGLAALGDVNGDGTGDIGIGSLTNGGTGCTTTVPSYANVFFGGQSIFSADVFSIQENVGATQTLQIDAGPAFGGMYYWVLGSTAGTSPGTPGFGTVMPLNATDSSGATDPYWNLTLNNPSGTPLSAPIGQLDPQGKATVQFTLNIVWPGSRYVAHAVALYDPSTGTVVGVSNPLPLGIYQ